MKTQIRSQFEDALNLNGEQLLTLTIGWVCIITWVFGYPHCNGVLIGFGLLFLSLFLKINKPYNKLDSEESNLTWLKLQSVMKAYKILVISIILINLANINLQMKITEFPKECMPETGWARVSANFNFRDYGVNPNDIVNFSDVPFDNLNRTISSCALKDKKSVIENIVTQSERHQNNVIYHIAKMSTIFGFIDDMTVEITPCGNHSNAYSINIQSVLRLGLSDLGVNPNRIADMYSCIAEEIPQDKIISRGKVCQL